MLLSGYYFWTLRPDVPLLAAAALPGLRGLLSYTVSPLLGWLQMPLLKWQMFSPTKVTDSFKARYSTGMALRPSQIRATVEDGALLIPGAVALRNHYGSIAIPTIIMAGDGDKVVFKRGAKRLAALIKGSTLQIVKGAGHMVHHVAQRRVLAAVESLGGAVELLAEAAD